jgi:hypothetical protein
VECVHASASPSIRLWTLVAHDSPRDGTHSSAGAYISIPRAVVAHFARGLRAPVWPPYSRSIANLQHWLLVDALRFLREASVPLFAHTFSSLSHTRGPITKASV